MSMRKPLAVLTARRCSPSSRPAAAARPSTRRARPPPRPPRPPRAGARRRGHGSISGKVTFDGHGAAPRRRSRSAADPKCAGACTRTASRSRRSMVKDGGLAHVFVYVKSGVTGSYPAPGGAGRARPAGLRRTTRTWSACRPASPSRSRTATTRCTTSIPRPTVNAEFNIGQPRKGMETSARPSTRRRS